jgi:taurine dioxygenase
MGTMLYALEVPSAGGDTLFTNQYLAYESLSDEMKKIAGQLRTVCVGDNFKAADGMSRKQRYDRQMSEMKVKDPGDVITTSIHPLVRTHPETGRKGLYVNAVFTSHLVGLTREASDRLLELLCRQASVPEYQCRFRWRQHSVAFWDNRAVQHYAASDYYPQRRLMERVTICGDVPQ